MRMNLINRIKGMMPVIVVGVLLTLPMSIQGKDAKPAAESVKDIAPAVEWESKGYDFGLMTEEGGPQQGEFRFVNRGEMPLMILGVRTSCGCTKADYSREEIQTGDTAVISFSYDPTRRPGPFEKTIRVTLTPAGEMDCEKPTHTEVLKIKGRVLASKETLDRDYPMDAGHGVRMSGKMINLGDIRAGASRHGYLQVLNAGEIPLYSETASAGKATDCRIVKLTSDSPALEVKLMPDTILPGDLGIVSFCLDTAKEPENGKRHHNVAMNILDGTDSGRNEITEGSALILEAWANIEGTLPGMEKSGEKHEKKRFSKKYVESKQLDGDSGGNKKSGKKGKKKGSRYGKTYTDVKKIPTEAEKAAAEANHGWKSTYTEVKKIENK